MDTIVLYNESAEEQFISDIEDRVTVFSGISTKVTFVTSYSSYLSSSGSAGSPLRRSRQLQQSNSKFKSTTPGTNSNVPSTPNVVVQYALEFPAGTTDAFIYSSMNS